MSFEKTITEFISMPHEEKRRLAREQLRMFRERERRRKEEGL